MSMTRCTISSYWCPKPSMPFLAAARSTSIVVPDVFAECTEDVTERDESEALELGSQSQLVASFFSLCVASSSFSSC